jgi:hypothetical protein
MVTCLSLLTRLETLAIGFELLGHDSADPSLHTNTLPVLSELRFSGVIECLEEIVARIDAPLLKVLVINSVNYHIPTPQLTQFIDRTTNFKSHDEANLTFSKSGVSVTFPQTFDGVLKLSVITAIGQPFQQLYFLINICNSSLTRTLVPAVEHLYVVKDGIWNQQVHPFGPYMNGQWLRLFRPFTAVKGLYISSDFMPRIADALQELVGERVREVLPALQNIFLEETPSSGPVQKTIGRFVAARQFSGHPVAVSRWE